MLSYLGDFSPLAVLFPPASSRVTRLRCWFVAGMEKKRERESPYFISRSFETGRINWSPAHVKYVSIGACRKWKVSNTLVRNSMVFHRVSFRLLIRVSVRRQNVTACPKCKNLDNERKWFITDETIMHSTIFFHGIWCDLSKFYIRKWVVSMRYLALSFFDVCNRVSFLTMIFPITTVFSRNI